MKKSLVILVLILKVDLATAQADKTIHLTLEDVVEIAHTNSPKYKLAQTQKEVDLYQYMIYKSDLKPQISIYGNTPMYNKSYAAVIQPDGSIQYLPVQQNINKFGISLSQKLPFSGGFLSLNTELSQFYDFQSKNRQYNGTPFYLYLSQPLSGFNELKWKNKIEPLKLEESRKGYAQEMEHINEDACSLYFDALIANSNMQIAQSSLANTEINYEIEKKKIPLGTTTEDKILQLQLQMLTKKQELEKSKYNYTIAELHLRSYLALKNEGSLALRPPENISFFQVDLDEAIHYTKLNRPEYVVFERKKLEAKRDVVQAKAQTRQINVIASYGYNRASDQVSNIYTDGKSQQTFTLGFNVPIIDWGRSKSRYKNAIALEKLTTYNADIDSTDIIQEITTLVKNIELFKNNIELSKTTDSVAKKRFLLANNLYQIGKLTITELNIAQSESENASRNYISALRNYWDSYYLLRRLTLYDFQSKELLYKD